MASPLRTGKQSVDLSAPVRVSRIRRDPPPPPPKVLSAHDRKVREAWILAVGVAAFALAIGILLFAIGNANAWSLSQYTIHFVS